VRFRWVSRTGTTSQRLLRGIASRWRKVRTGWDGWTRRDLAGEAVVRLVLDGTAMRVRPGRNATNIPLLEHAGRERRDMACWTA